MRSRLFYTATAAMLFITLSFFISPSFADPLDNWHIREQSFSYDLLHSVTYGNGLFVAVGDWSTILTSPDGINWTKRASPANVYDRIRINGITFGNGIFVAVGDVWDSFGFPRGHVILRSVDGIEWTATFTSETFESIAYGNGSFVAVGFGIVANSSDGIKWSYTNTEADFINITFENHMFLALVRSGSSVSTSLDGRSWNVHNIGGSLFSGITYGQGITVVVGGRGCFEVGIPCAGQMIDTSPDMVNWTRRNTERRGWSVLNAITYGMGSFVAVGTSEIAVSSDGVTWALIDLPIVPSLTAITHNGNTFVAVGENGTILQSDPIPYENEAVGVPTLNEWGMILFMVLAGLVAILNLCNHTRAS